MSQKVEVTTVCDRPYEPGHDHPARRKVRLSLGSNAWEADLCALHEDAARELLAPFISAARPVRSTPVRPAGKAKRPAQVRARAADVRAWAKDRGLVTNDRGRMADSVVARYEAAQRGRW